MEHPAHQELSCKLQTVQREVQPQIFCFLSLESVWGHALEWGGKIPLCNKYLTLGVWIEKCSLQDQA